MSGVDDRPPIQKLLDARLERTRGAQPMYADGGARQLPGGTPRPRFDAADLDAMAARHHQDGYNCGRAEGMEIGVVQGHHRGLGVGREAVVVVCELAAERGRTLHRLVQGGLASTGPKTKQAQIDRLAGALEEVGNEVSYLLGELKAIGARADDGGVI